jgi:hypothetical protein
MAISARAQAALEEEAFARVVDARMKRAAGLVRAVAARRHNDGG